MKFEEALTINEELINEYTAERYAEKLLISSPEQMKQLNNRIIAVETKGNNGRYIPTGDYNITMGSGSGLSRFFKDVQKHINYDSADEKLKQKFVLSLNDLAKKD